MANVIKRLTGRVAIVTASTDEIGFSVAKRLAQEGAKVIISSRKEKNVQEATKKLTEAGFDVEGLVCHVSKAEDRKELFEKAKKYGKLDILVSNAAANPAIGKNVFDCSESEWDKIFDVNVKSSFLLAKESIPLLKQSKAGRIIFVSTASVYHPLSFLGAYLVSKTALLGLVKTGSLQLANDGITVNCVAPGIIETKFGGVLTSPGKLSEELLKKIPQNRFGKPEDIDGAVAFLASDDASYITGETIAVSGGINSRL